MKPAHRKRTIGLRDDTKVSQSGFQCSEVCGRSVVVGGWMGLCRCD